MNLNVDKDKFSIIGIDDIYKTEVITQSLSSKERAWRKFKKNKLGLVSIIILMILLPVILTSPFWAIDKIHVAEIEKNNSITATQDTGKLTFDNKSLFFSNYKERNMTPSFKHLFGTDENGIDIFKNSFFRGRLSILFGITCALINITLGALYGGISGYFGGLIDDIMMRVAEILSSIPNILWVSILVFVVGNSFNSMVIAMSIMGWTEMAFLIRGQVMQLKEQEFTLACQALGGDYGRVIVIHIIPNITSMYISGITCAIPKFIMYEALLSYIKLGIASPYATLGSLLMQYTMKGSMIFYPYQILLPSIFLMVIILCFQIFGDALADALDPKLE
ncbi:MAG: ABC transporter permease [Clostridium sp.]|uniref:ABC transporter permease n=1 Tax=Clostridium sp. TaxID=1506 RepID=UPI003D6CE2A2